MSCSRVLQVITQRQETSPFICFEPALYQPHLPSSREQEKTDELYPIPCPLLPLSNHLLFPQTAAISSLQLPFQRQEVTECCRIPCRETTDNVCGSSLNLPFPSPVSFLKQNDQKRNTVLKGQTHHRPTMKRIHFLLPYESTYAH